MAMLVPPPGVGDDRLQIRVLGLPPKDSFGAIATPHKHRGISRAAILGHCWDGMARHLAGSFNHFSDGKAVAVAEIERRRGLALEQIFQASEVSCGQIPHMNVIPDAGAIWGRIVCA